MDLLCTLLFCIVSVTEGSSLWSFSHVNKEIYFTVDHNINSVRVEALVKDLSPQNENYTKNINLFLFARRSQQGIELQINDNATLVHSGFNFSVETKLLIHGFANSASSTFSILMKNPYIQQLTYNVIIVDWSALCVPPFYSSAVDNASQVGARTAELVIWLVSQGVRLSLVHLLGHSVGAHIAGIVGRTVTERMQGRLARITGLDPAKPMFDREAASFQLRSTDAEFVDCIHTCGGFLGLSEPVCSADFYPNGGTSPQPGCQFDFFGICSHQRAYKYYVESIIHQKSFSAVRCSAIESYSPVNCSSDSVVIMGEHADTRSRGIFYLATSSKSPFSLKNSNVLFSALKKFSWYFL